MFPLLKKISAEKNRKPPPPQKNQTILGPFRISVAHRAPRLCTAVAERAIEDTFTDFRKRRAQGIVGLHIQHGFETWWLNVEIHSKKTLKKCMELGVTAIRKSRRGGRKGGEGWPTHPQDCRARNRILHGVRSHDQLHKQRKERAHR